MLRDCKYNSQVQKWEGFSPTSIFPWKALISAILNQQMNKVLEKSDFLSLAPKCAYFSLSQAPAFFLTGVRVPPVSLVYLLRSLGEGKVVPALRERIDLQEAKR